MNWRSRKCSAGICPLTLLVGLATGVSAQSEALPQPPPEILTLE